MEPHRDDERIDMGSVVCRRTRTHGKRTHVRMLLVPAGMCAFDDGYQCTNRRWSESMTGNSKLRFSMPTMEMLPKPEASLREVGRFLHDHDPTLYFHELWGDAYKENVQSLRQQYVNAYKDGTPATGRGADLLMCMAYDWALGPYLGVPDSQKLDFLQWLLAGVRQQLASRL